VHHIHQVTPAKCKLFNKLFQHHERQHLQNVGTKATGPTSIFAKQLAHRKIAAKDEDSSVATTTAYERLRFQMCESNAETEATTWSLADMEIFTIQLEREIYGFTSNEQKRFKKDFSVHLIEFQARCETIHIQVLWETIEQ
jgi:hypothetical protein